MKRSVAFSSTGCVPAAVQTRLGRNHNISAPVIVVDANISTLVKADLPTTEQASAAPTITVVFEA